MRKISKIPERNTTIASSINNTLLVPLVIFLTNKEESSMIRVITAHISKVIILGIRTFIPTFKKK